VTAARSAFAGMTVNTGPSFLKKLEPAALRQRAPRKTPGKVG
jgi:hypothetical protein